MINVHMLGSTDVRVSSLGLGLAALGRPGYVNLGHATDLQSSYDVEAMQAHTHAVLNAAWDLGIRYFDAARSYGRAEQFLSSWLRTRQIATSDIAVGSKWGYTYTADWQVNAETHEVKEHTLPVLQRQWYESQLSLGKYLRLYQIHSATVESGVLDNMDVLTELDRLKADGMLIGLSLSGVEQASVLRKAIKLQIEGTRLFDCVQATWNLLEPSVAPMLQEARTAGMGVIVKEALANGRLTQRNTDPTFAARRAVLEKQAARLNTTIDALVLAAALEQPWADVILSGAATVEQVQSNVRALDIQLDEEATVALETLVEPPEVYWQIRKDLAWN